MQSGRGSSATPRGPEGFLNHHPHGEQAFRPEFNGHTRSFLRIHEAVVDAESFHPIATLAIMCSPGAQPGWPRRLRKPAGGQTITPA